MDGNELIYDFKKRSDASGLVCKDPSKTVQSEAIDADINTIVKRFGITGHLPQNLKIPSYGDYDQVNDYQSALDAITDAEEQFMSIPADIRSRFGNDAGTFLHFAADPDNYDALAELGLAKARVPATVEVPKVGV
ncbi:MAG: internal scaffolding protein [Microvirus sp.]|nr:MAG: internal scaffolding protein [Microvirus sp.]